MGGFNFDLDPYVNFKSLFDEAVRLKIPEPNAMALATVGKDNKPSVRTVLFKGILRDGFSFYTNYDGQKARDIAYNSNVCLNFFWPQLEQQIRIQGQALKCTRGESEDYFKTRPRLSQLGSMASKQSEALESFDSLNAKVKELDKKYENQLIPCPPNWGGYIIVPEAVEFWFGRQGRMHERYKYSRTLKSWNRQLLNP